MRIKAGLPQAFFREAVLSAYRGRCTISRLHKSNSDCWSEASHSRRLANLEERAVMDIEQPVRHMDAEFGIDPDQVSMESRMERGTPRRQPKGL